MDGVHPVVCTKNEIIRTQLHYIKINLAIPARVKVELTLNFLATANTSRTLEHLFRICSCRLQLLFHLFDCNVIVSDFGVFQNCSSYTALENGLLPE